jgi:hypothetical protein
VQVHGRLARLVVGLEEPEALIAALVRAVALDRRVAPAPFELVDVHAQQVQPLNLFRDGASDAILGPEDAVASCACRNTVGFFLLVRRWAGILK